MFPNQSKEQVKPLAVFLTKNPGSKGPIFKNWPENKMVQNESK